MTASAQGGAAADMRSRARARRKAWRRVPPPRPSQAPCASPCGRPPGAVRPRPTTVPSFTTIAPTAGFGQVVPSAPPPAGSPPRDIGGRAPQTSSSTADLVAGRARRRTSRNPSPRGNRDRPRRSAHRRRRRGSCSPSMTRRPMSCAGISCSPRLSSWRTMPGDHPLDPLRIDGPLAERHLDGAHELVAVEGHAPARSLQHGQLAELHPLEGGEAAAAFDADAPPPDGRVVFRRPRILHLRVGGSAIGTAHGRRQPW